MCTTIKQYVCLRTTNCTHILIIDLDTEVLIYTSHVFYSRVQIPDGILSFYDTGFRHSMIQNSIITNTLRFPYESNESLSLNPVFEPPDSKLYLESSIMQ